MANVGYFNAQGGVYNFKAPKKGTGKKETQFPYVDSQVLALESNKADAEVTHTVSILTLGSDNLAAAATLDLDLANAPVGACVYLIFKCGGTKYDVTVKSGESTLASVTGVANKTNMASFLWSGTELLAI